MNLIWLLQKNRLMVKVDGVKNGTVPKKVIFI